MTGVATCMFSRLDMTDGIIDICIGAPTLTALKRPPAMAIGVMVKDVRDVKPPGVPSENEGGVRTGEHGGMFAMGVMDPSCWLKTMVWTIPF